MEGQKGGGRRAGNRREREGSEMIGQERKDGRKEIGKEKRGGEKERRKEGKQIRTKQTMG